MLAECPRQGLAASDWHVHRSSGDVGDLYRRGQAARSRPQAHPATQKSASAFGLMVLIDSDHFSIIANRQDRKHAALIARLRAANDDIVLPIIVVEEVLRGRLGKLRRVQSLSELSRPYDQLAETIR